MLLRPFGSRTIGLLGDWICHTEPRLLTEAPRSSPLLLDLSLYVFDTSGALAGELSRPLVPLWLPVIFGTHTEAQELPSQMSIKSEAILPQMQHVTRHPQFPLLNVSELALRLMRKSWFLLCGKMRPVGGGT